jgi:hypothetical protein
MNGYHNQRISTEHGTAELEPAHKQDIANRWHLHPCCFFGTLSHNSSDEQQQWFGNKNKTKQTNST